MIPTAALLASAGATAELRQEVEELKASGRHAPQLPPAPSLQPAATSP